MCILERTHIRCYFLSADCTITKIIHISINALEIIEQEISWESEKKIISRKIRDRNVMLCVCIYILRYIIDTFVHFKSLKRALLITYFINKW